MSSSFSRTLRSIETDGLRRWLWIGVPALLVIGAWTVWLVRARVTVYASSQSARLAVEGAVFPIEAPLAGRVSAVRVALETHVNEGDVLVELDASDLVLALAAERTKLASLEAQIADADRELVALQHASNDVHASGEAALREADLATQSLAVSVQIAEDEATRLARLGQEGGVSALTVSKAKAEGEKARIALASQKIAIERTRVDQRRIESEREAAIASLRRRRTENVGACDASRAEIARLTHDIEVRSVRSPASGDVAEIARLASGTYVEAGERLGAVVARGELAVEAQFAPSDALGRVHVGQRGELRLDGFSWVRYGALTVEVRRIASEARDGTIRVELALVGDLPRDIPLGHGLPGRVEVALERESPLDLVMRAVGKSTGAPVAAAAR